VLEEGYIDREIPDFDDPNIDFDEAIDGVLGITCPSLPYETTQTCLSAEDDSPYPEVRAAVANTDNPDLPSSTIRAWVLGLIWAILIAVRFLLFQGMSRKIDRFLQALNQFFFFRFPSVVITNVSDLASLEIMVD